MTIKMSGLSNGALPMLAADANQPTNGYSTASTVSGIDASAGLTTALSLSGKYAIRLLQFEDLTNEACTIKLTIDGDVLFDRTSTFGAACTIIGKTQPDGVGHFQAEEAYACNSSLLLEIETATDTSISLRYIVRKIL